MGGLTIARATIEDVPTILAMVRALAVYEKLAHEVVATEADMRASLFGDTPRAEVAIARVGDTPVGLAIWFHNYSTFLGRAGLYLEDLFVLPEWRKRGIGRRLLGYVAALAVERQCGRLEWSVLDWNDPAIRIYRGIGAKPMDEWTVYRLTGEPLRALAETGADLLGDRHA